MLRNARRPLRDALAALEDDDIDLIDFEAVYEDCPPARGNMVAGIYLPGHPRRREYPPHDTR